MRVRSDCVKILINQPVGISAAIHASLNGIFVIAAVGQPAVGRKGNGNIAGIACCRNRPFAK